MSSDGMSYCPGEFVQIAIMRHGRPAIDLEDLKEQRVSPNKPGEMVCNYESEFQGQSKSFSGRRIMGRQLSDQGGDGLFETHGGDHRDLIHEGKQPAGHVVIVGH